MAVKWSEVQTKLTTYLLIGLIGLVFATYRELQEVRREVAMIKATVTAVWESE